MKIIGINGSPHKNGNTATAINKIFEGAEFDDCTTEIIHLSDLNLQYCN